MIDILEKNGQTCISHRTLDVTILRCQMELRPLNSPDIFFFIAAKK